MPHAPAGTLPISAEHPPSPREPCRFSRTEIWLQQRSLYRSSPRNLATTRSSSCPSSLVSSLSFNLTSPFQPNLTVASPRASTRLWKH
jgi:hypothetical protein